MKTINVVAAIIFKDGKIFATQRGYGQFKDGWEFPGGKTETGETDEQALKREIMEELDAQIEVCGLVDCVDYDYPDFHLKMNCYKCLLVGKEPVISEHEAACWVDADGIDGLAWLPADLSLVEKLKKMLKDGSF